MRNKVASIISCRAIVAGISGVLGYLGGEYQLVHDVIGLLRLIVE